MMEDPLHILLQAIFLLAAGMYPLGFLFGACSACCDETDGCQWFIDLDRCMKVDVVGSDPPQGTTCTIRPTQNLDLFIAGNVAVWRVPSELEMQVRVYISRLSPPTETRTITYRFPQSHCVAGCAGNSLNFAYDDASPGWHLEVEVTVNRVYESAEAGIISQNVGEDAAGQRKLFLEVNYFHRPYVDFEELSDFFAIRPIAIQRRFVFSGGVGVLHAGDGTGITVSIQRTTVTRRSFAVGLGGTVCGGWSGAFNPTLVDKWTFDRAESFLAGETFRVDSTATNFTQYDLTLMPSTVLCDLPSNALGHGVSIGAYPNTVYADTNLTSPCFGELSVEMQAASRPGLGSYQNEINTASPCAFFWSRNFGLPGSLIQSDAVSASSLDFYAGRSLLWNLEHGPYRRSFMQPSGRTIRFDGGATEPDRYYMSPMWFDRPCRDYATLPCHAREITVSYPEETIQASIAFAGSIFQPPGVCRDPYSDLPPKTIEGGTAVLSLGRPNLGSNPTNHVFYNLPGFAEAYNTAGLFYYGQIYSPNYSVPFGSGDSIYYATVWQHFFAWGYVSPCTRPQTVPMTGLKVTWLMDNFHSVSGDEGAGTDRTFAGISFFSAYCSDDHGGLIDPNQGPPQALTVDSIEVRDVLRKVCGPWSPTTLPVSGGTLTRQCEIKDSPSETAYEVITETIEVPPSRTMNNRVIGAGVTQEGSCKLVALREQVTSVGSFGTSDKLSHTFSPTPTNPCKFLRPVFGRPSAGFSCGEFTDYPARALPGDDSPCLSDCTIEVTVATNSEQLSATYITSGEKAGFIRLTAKAGWEYSSTATIVVSCGEDSIEVTITGG